VRLVQHKEEAWWFYRFLSNFYDKLVNPLFWTARMRDECLVLAKLNHPDLNVIDVGSGTGFNTEGIVKHIPASQVTCVDQSPHQLARAKRKEVIKYCTFLLGDAENIPAETDSFDRYTSTGSIEYWPNPQQGLMEAYRVIKPGGIALMVGPIEPKGPIAKFLANTWMLFPKEEEYFQWMKGAGFEDIQHVYTAPHWIPGREKYGIGISGRKPESGVSPGWQPIASVTESGEKKSMSFGRKVQLFFRVIIGSLAGFFFIPGALIGYLFAIGKQNHLPKEQREKLNAYQISVLVILGLLLLFVIYKIVS
jgi:MPBQ/MSBQ methyltransferase